VSGTSSVMTVSTGGELAEAQRDGLQQERGDHAREAEQPGRAP